MTAKDIKRIPAGLLLALVLILCMACGGKGRPETGPAPCSREEVLLEREGVSLHLSRIREEGADPERQILLAHGVTYSSHIFDKDYEDYSLARKLAREGYGVWLLDIAGFGLSEEVKDGFLPDSDYAAEELAAAAEKIREVTVAEKIDVLGWSWGTVTAGRFAAAHPDLVDRLVLYAPILGGLGEIPVEEDFHHNTWAHAAEDFQTTPEGEIDPAVTDPVLVQIWCSECWRYDGDASPNGGRRDLCVKESERLIDLTKIQSPTLVICGDQDPYLDFDLISGAADLLPEGSRLEVIEGGAHAVMVEKPFYHDFQDRLIRFLKEGRED